MFFITTQSYKLHENVLRMWENDFGSKTEGDSMLVAFSGEAAGTLLILQNSCFSYKEMKNLISIFVQTFKFYQHATFFTCK
jgi:hypothetical protein